MLVPALAVDAQLGEQAAQLLAVDAVLCWQAQTQRAVGVAKLKVVDRRRRDAAPLEVRKRLGRGLQRRVVEGRDVVEGGGMVGTDGDWRRQLARRDHRRQRQRGLLFQQRDGVTEAHALLLHHEREDVAAGAAAEAVPQAFVRRDLERGRIVVVKRTATDEIAALRLQGNHRADDGSHVDGGLQRLKVVLRKSAHGRLPPERVKCRSLCETRLEISPFRSMNNFDLRKRSYNESPQAVAHDDQ